MQGSISDKTQINIETDTHGSHHEAHPDFRIFGLIVFLVAEGMIFLGLFIAYMAFRAMAPEWPPSPTYGVRRDYTRRTLREVFRIRQGLLPEIRQPSCSKRIRRKPLAASASF